MWVSLPWQRLEICSGEFGLADVIPEAFEMVEKGFSYRAWRWGLGFVIDSYRQLHAQEPCKDLIRT